MVTPTWKKLVPPCWRPFVEDEGENSSNGGGDSSGHADSLWWHKDYGHHHNGEFSMAVIQANVILEDQSQLESGPLSSNESGPYGTFVGVYDGHGGPETARFIRDRLFENLRKFTSENREMSADVIKNAFLATEEEFLSLVRKQWDITPKLASVGSCCLVGVICGGQLYIANAGDSRVVLGRLSKAEREVKAIQLSTEHNANLASVRDELHTLHPDDPGIVVLKHNVWRVKGIIQVSRSIGDAYLKKSEFNKPPLLPKFRLPEPFEKPFLLAEPSILVQELHPQDEFLIFASDGLWEHLSNQEAVDIVNSSPRNGIARKLVKAALQEAAKKREMRYSDLKRIDRGVRRHFHDDITVIVLFLDSNLISSSSSSLRGPVLSIKANGIAGQDTDT
ncbi:probable protein phosphatase 2C 38 isoform X1 [Salvia miltiorrhiza]|uniref:probable protein phosphatase 2C 38 isoform X1 n=2 Tax=Salvia miltiorrhiza TaxID=226208 RepID=UPI0025AC7A0F|nr:probable protein phosphatase 2C 38 isoform X1 [Salvia miltiorrhiza]